MNERLEKLLVRTEITVKEAIRKMDDTGERILFVVGPENKLRGTVTDGDLRRWILKDGNLSAPLDRAFNRCPTTVPDTQGPAIAREIMIQKKIDVLPVVNSGECIVDAFFWSDIFAGQVKPKNTQLDIPVLVMAGGRGTRLDPLTRILPKPLVPFGDKPIVEIIMDQFAEFGCHSFFLTVNYMGKMIQAYFDNGEVRHRVHLIWEETPMGTAGSLKLALPLIDYPHLFVSNCDIVIKADYGDVFNFHTSNENDVTMIGSMQHVSVPFGVLEMKNGGTLQNIVEKPEYDFLANTGMYLIRREVIQHIPDGIPFDFTDLILKVKEKGGKVGVYPVSQQSWIDIGQWQEFHTALRKIEI